MAGGESHERGTTRRRFLRDAGATGVGLAASTGVGRTAAAIAAAGRRQTVAVFGGGIAGLTVAHELAERGFDVTIYERRAWGGKARSTTVPGTGTGGRKDLPGEHGWRVFFGFYQNLPDTFRRIPYGSHPHGVFDNLVGAPQFGVSRDGGRRDLILPLGAADPSIQTADEVLDLVIGAALQLHLPPEAVAQFADRMLVYFSSCDARRIGQWENVNWIEFSGGDRYGDDYRRILVNSVSEVVQASKAERTSAQFPSHVWEFVIYNLLRRNSNGAVFRFMNRPTNEAFIDPWLRVLDGLGVQRRVAHELVGWSVSGGRITGAQVRTPGGVAGMAADWYVCALPVERARALWSPAILAADPHLARMANLDTAWMNGMKLFLREAGHPAIKGTVDYVDSAWQLTSVSQAQFWPLDFAGTYGDGRVCESLSVIISKWTAPGIVYGKAAEECTEGEVIAEVWAQMKRHLNDTGKPVLTDDLLLSWDIDPGMIRSGGRLISDDPLVLPTVGQRPDRPDVTTRIPNLLLAGDYLKSDWEVANMETANFNGRRAANALLAKSGSRETPAKAIPTYRPPEWEPFKRIDEVLYKQGKPNLFYIDFPGSPDAVRARMREATAALG